jgi:hypothetical protein
MKDEYKILIGAVVVIIIVLVGAFALSGSGGPGPSVTPTASVEPEITPTPTVVPGGEGGTPTVSPEPSVVPSVTPVPSTEPESGVKLTEFGYWITYPPLPPQTWSSPKPGPGPQNIVYFEPTSAYIPALDIFEPEALLKEGGNYRQTMVYRLNGDINATVNVTICVTTSGNIWHSYEIDEKTAVDYDYEYWMHGDNLTEVGYNEYQMVFGPGVSEQYICVHVDPYYGLGSVDGIITKLLPEGWVKLTITGADGGYSVGANKDFTINIKNIPMVSFNYDAYGALWNNDGEVGDGGYFDSVDSSGDIVYVTLPIYRYFKTGGDLSVNLDWYLYDGSDDLDAGAITIQPFAFDDGQSVGYVTVGIDKGVILDDNWYRLVVYIDDSDDYVIDYDEFWIDINVK